MSTPKTRPDDVESELPSADPQSHIRVKPETLSEAKGQFTEEDIQLLMDRVAAEELTGQAAVELIIQNAVDHFSPVLTDHGREEMTAHLRKIAEAHPVLGRLLEIGR